jgi:hypothetical protein
MDSPKHGLHVLTICTEIFISELRDVVDQFIDVMDSPKGNYNQRSLNTSISALNRKVNVYSWTVDIWGEEIDSRVSEVIS